MDTYPVKNDDGRISAFEVESSYISIGRIKKLLSEVSHVSNLLSRRPFSGNSEFRLGFTYAGVPFVVLEPFGDNSRYWIGPENDSNPSDLEQVANLELIFKGYKPPIPIKILADIVTLKFIRS